MGMVKRVVLIVAMQEEAEPFIKAHQLKEQKESPFAAGMPMVCYSGKIHAIEVLLVWTGRDKRYKVNNVATTAASVAAYAAFTAYKPDMVLSAGTAGGFGAVGAEVGDVFISTKCVFHNRRIPSGDEYEEYGFGHFRSPSLPLLAEKCGLKQGVVSTSDCLDCSPIDLELMRSEGASVKEMEAAAIAWVCQQIRVPFLAGHARDASCYRSYHWCGPRQRIMVGHVSPEAAMGGPIGRVRDGDVITIDPVGRRLDVALSDASLSAPPVTGRGIRLRGLLAKYATSVGCASEGALTWQPATI